MYELKKLDKEQSTVQLGDRLCGIIKKELKVTITAKNPFIWLDYKAGNKLIEILKKYISHTKKS